MKKPKLFIALLRIALGWLFLYQGISAINTPGWSLLPYIQNAKTFSSFYQSISVQPSLGYFSYATIGLLVLVGGLLVLGLVAQLASMLGILLMLFFYFPLLNFPHVGTSYYIVDEHII